MTSPLTRPVRADRVPAGGKTFLIEADESERRALAEALEIAEIVELKAELAVRPLAGDAYGVGGRLTAVVVQTDVVTLEPVRQSVNEAIELTLVPAEDMPAPGAQGGMPAGLQGDADRDTYSGGRIDLGAIVAEHLALGLDPYPRAPGVEFSGHVEDDSSGPASPFAALARLKRKTGRRR